MSEELETESEKSPWIWKAAIVALPVGLALSAVVAMAKKISDGEKTGMEGVVYNASDFEVANLRDTAEKIEEAVGERDFETETGQKAMVRLTALIQGSLSSLNLGYQVQSDDGMTKAGRIWKNYWIDSGKQQREGDLLVWTTYSQEEDSASVAALLSVAEWMRGREFERRVRIAFLWGDEALPTMQESLNQKKSQISLNVSGIGQGTYGVGKDVLSGTPFFESHYFYGKEGERTETDWKMTFAWEGFEQQVNELCEEVSELAGEKVVFEK